MADSAPRADVLVGVEHLELAVQEKHDGRGIGSPLAAL
jgi:hypothetical protein